jgi:6-phosphogluconate dehydrogenase
MAAPQNARIGVAGLAVMGQVRLPRGTALGRMCEMQSNACCRAPNLACAQNLALNIAEKGYTVALYNRTESKTDDTCARARAEGALPRDALLNAHARAKCALPHEAILNAHAPAMTQRLRCAGLGANVRGFHDTAAFVHSLHKPRTVIMMVQAGRAVDETIEKLALHMEPGDVLIDGGNSFYEDTERRVRELGAQGIAFLGMGARKHESSANVPKMATQACSCVLASLCCHP